MDKLICRLCISKLQSPKMCPHCSQVFCQACIRNYLAQKHFCPSCDNYIIDLVDCGRLVDELNQMVHAKKSSGNLVKLCKQHQLQLNYYCKDCSVWICSDCGVIYTGHRGHQILSKKQGYSLSKDNINLQLSKVKQKLLKINAKKQKSIIDLQVYRTQLKWSKQRIQRYYQSIISKLQMQGTKQINQLVQKITEYQNVFNELKDKQQELQKMIQTESVVNSKIYSSLKNTKKMSTEEYISVDFYDEQLLSRVMDQEQNLFFNKVSKIQTIQQVFPTFANYTYQFDFQNLRHDNFHYSDYFELWGQDWRLKIYPNGNSGVSGKFLSVFLELANGHHLEKPKKYIYRIQLLSLNKACSTIVKEYCSVFDSGQSWGYSDFLDINHLEQYLHEGKLLFSIGIRNQSYQGLCCDLKKYIVKIQNENKILEKLLCEGSIVDHSVNASKIKEHDISDCQSSIRMDEISQIEFVTS